MRLPIASVSDETDVKDVSQLQRRLQKMHALRDEFWDLIVQDLARRNPLAAERVRAIIAEWPIPLQRGRATTFARRAWSALDLQAREDWLWVCEFMQQMWFRGYLTAA